MGSQHARNAARSVSDCELVALQDLDRDRAERLGRELGVGRLYDTPEELVASGTVDALLVASPDETHFRIVESCIAAGLPVLCEKPLASELKDALEVVRTEARAGARLASVGFMRRFDPGHRAVKRAADSGAIGRPLLWKGVHRNARTPYDSSGPFILANSAGHDFDSARWLLGTEIAEVSVLGLRSRDDLPDESRDLLLVRMAMADGRLGSAELFMSADYGYEVSAELVGQLGVATTAQPELSRLRSKGFRGTEVTSDWTAPFQAAYLAELAEWIGSLVEGRPFSGASAWDGYAAMAASAAASESLLRGRPAKVELAARPELYL